MNKEDQEKTAFVTNQGLYCYKVMMFGLKNTGTTYQRLVNQMFNKKIGKNIKVSVDNMLVKSKEAKTHLDDLQETFNTLRRYIMKLNLDKRVFGVLSGEFLNEKLRQI